MLRFGLIGSAGYVAPKHFKAIIATGGEIVAHHDLNDSVGAIDKHHPAASFTTNLDEFWIIARARHATHIVIATPNHTHYSLAAQAMIEGFDVVLEKPAGLDEEQIQMLMELEFTTGRKCYCVLQMRLFDKIVAARKIIRSNDLRNMNVVILYNTFRGHWYSRSWKGDPDLSGGLMLNLGVHLFDLCEWMFGNVSKFQVAATAEEAGGTLITDRTTINFHLSSIVATKYERKMSINGAVIDFTTAVDLHSRFYATVNDGTATRLQDAVRSVRLVNALTAGNLIREPS